MSSDLPARHDRPNAPARMVVALLAAILVALLGSFGSGPRTASAADPTPTPSDTGAPSPIPSPTVSPAPSATPTPGPITLGASVTFYGRGYGHGVGMSQYGARGRALAGQASATILAHYYRDTTVGSIDPVTKIRVLVLSKWKATAAAPFVLYGRRTTWSIDGIAATFPVDASLRLVPTTTTTTTTTGTRTSWRIVVNAAGGAVLYSGAKPATVVIRGSTGSSRLQVWSKPGLYDQYRGVLRVIATSASPAVTVVNELPLEQYLAGVVPVEMPSTWPAAALEAQAVAARSYAARRLRPGVSFYDVPDDSRSQVYRGVLAEKTTTNAVIKATAGKVLMSGSTIANTMFHSTAGGATENNENVYTSSTGAIVAGAVSYLRGSSDRTAEGVSYDAGAPYATWSTRTYSLAQLSAWFAADPRTNVGTLKALDLRRRGISGRLISVTLIGSAGTKQVSGEVFRSVFNAARPSADPMLRSTLLGIAPIP